MPGATKLGTAGPSLAAVLVALLVPALTACTTICWRDGDGTEHMLGLFAYRFEDLGEGQVLRTTRLGLDLRLAGNDRGYSIGYKSTDEYVPLTVHVSDPDQLSDLVWSQLSSAGRERGSTEPSGTRRGFFYLAHELSPQATIVDTTSVGADLRVGTVSPGMSLGLSTNRHVVNRALESGVVQLHLLDARRPDRESLTLWVLDPKPLDDGRGQVALTGDAHDQDPAGATAP